MSFRNVVDFSDSHDSTVQLNVPAPLPSPSSPLCELLATKKAIEYATALDERYTAASDLEHDYYTEIKHNVYAYSNPGIPGFFDAEHPSVDPEVFLNLGNKRKIDELRVRMEYQQLRRRKLETFLYGLNLQIDTFVNTKHMVLREMVNSRLRQNYDQISIELIDDGSVDM